jgi:hypothetical protein
MPYAPLLTAQKPTYRTFGFKVLVLVAELGAAEVGKRNTLRGVL